MPPHVSGLSPRQRFFIKWEHKCLEDKLWKLKEFQAISCASKLES